MASNEVANFTGQQVTNLTGPPTVQSATVEGSTLTLTFSEALKTTTAPGTSRFTVAGTASTTSVTAVGFKTGDAKSVELTLSPAVAGSDTGITVSYAKGTDANPLQDLASNEVADFSSQQVTNVTDDTTAPTVQSATVDGSTLTLTFSEALKTTTAPGTSRFTVAGTTSTTSVTAVGFKTGDAKSVELTISPAVAVGASGITVSYAKGSDANPLQDAAGNEVANFSGQQVTNTSEPARPTACPDPADNPETWFSSVTSTSSSISVTFADPLPGPYTSPANIQLSVCFNRPTGWSIGSPQSWNYGTNPPTAGETVTITSPDATLSLTASTDYWVKISGFYGAADSNWHYIRTKDADTTAPTLQSATVDGATLTLTYNEALKTTNAPGASRFTVAGTASATTVTAVGFKSGDAKSVELTLSPAVTAGDSGVTVSYAKGVDPNPLQDTSGNQAADFSGQQVTNKTLPTLQSAEVTGVTLTLTFNAALKLTLNSVHQPIVPAASRFTLSGVDRATTVTDVTFDETSPGVFDPRVLELTLSLTVHADQTFTVSYAKGSDANPLQATNGDEIADFSGVKGVNWSPARVKSAEVYGSTLTVTFNAALNTAIVPAASRFTVAGTESATSVTAVAFKSGDAASLELTLSQAVAAGHTGITVSYALGPLANALQNAAGIHAIPFTGQQVTYNTPRPRPPGDGGGVSPPTRGGTPVADAGADLEVDPGASVTLDGSGSSDPDGDTLTFAWSQASGASAALSDAGTAAPSFDAPEPPGALVFRLTVSDPSGLTDSDDVTVTVRDVAPSFGAAAVSSLTLVLDEAVEPVVLPEATGGNGALSYALTSAPAGLAGLSFDPASRRLSGAPSAEGSYEFTYTAHDADANRAASDAAVLMCQSALKIAPLSACKIDPLGGTAEVVPVANRGDPRGFV